MKGLVQKDKNLFFSGPGDYEFKAQLYARANGLNVLVDVLDQEMTTIATDAGGQITKLYWNRVSQAFSEVTSGKAYALLPGDPALGTTWYKGTLWDQVEWPALVKNRYVPEVIRINPSILPGDGINIKL
jgi:hypothetical protein